MTGTIIFLSDSTRDSSTEAVSATRTEATEANESFMLTEKVIQHASSVVGGTNIETKVNEAGHVKSVPIERIYPHVFDDEVASGEARINLLNALEDARLALDSFGEADIASVSTRLTLIATTMSNTHRVTEFNESLGAVVSFLRRAMLAASASEITRPALNALVHVLQYISANPMIDLEDAAELVDKLSNEGWQGEHGFAEALVAVLLDDLDTEIDANAQTQLFEELQDEAQ